MELERSTIQLLAGLLTIFTFIFILLYPFEVLFLVILVTFIIVVCKWLIPIEPLYVKDFGQEEDTKITIVEEPIESRLQKSETSESVTDTLESMLSPLNSSPYPPKTIKGIGEVTRRIPLD